MGSAGSSLRPKLRIGELLVLRFERIDLIDHRPDALDLALVLRADDFFNQIQHI